MWNVDNRRRCDDVKAALVNTGTYTHSDNETTLEILQKASRHAQEAIETGLLTTHQLHIQGEQMERIDSSLDEVEKELGESDRTLRKMSWGSKIKSWFKPKTKKLSNGTGDVPSVLSSSLSPSLSLRHQQQKQRVGRKDDDVVVVVDNNNNTAGVSQSACLSKEEDKLIDTLIHDVSILREQATLQGTLLTEHNHRLDMMGGKIDVVNVHMGKTNRKSSLRETHAELFYMQQCGSLLQPALRRTSATYIRRGGAVKWKGKGKGKGTRRGSRSVAGVRDSVGMLIPEARLRRDGISPNVFDRSIQEKARDILGLDKGDARGSALYGASFDRCEIRFQGKGSDLRQFAEMATRAVSTQKWGDKALGNKGLPTNAVAFVGGKRQSDKTSNNTSDVLKETGKGGSSVMLQRAFKRYGGTSSTLANVITTGDITTNAETGGDVTAGVKLGVKETSKTEGKRRAERRQRRIERMSNREGDVHPCVYQGGCTFHGGAAMCPFVQYPAAVCVVWLRHGRCEDLLSGCCPWWHGSVADTSKREVDFDSLFCGVGCAEVDNEVDNDSEVIRDNCTWMGMLLQMFLDVLVTAIEGAQLELNEGTLTMALLQQYLDKMRGSTTQNMNANVTDIPFHYDMLRSVLSVEWELGVSCLMTQVGATLVQKNNEENASPFDATLIRNLMIPMHSHSVWGEGADVKEEQRLRDTSEARIRRVMATFRGYVSVIDTPEGLGAQIALCTPLTRWLLQRTVDEYNKKGSPNYGGPTVQTTPERLFEEASMVLLRKRLEMCEIGSNKEGNSEVSLHRWSTLLLLQLMALFVRISVPCSVSYATGCAERSLLYTQMLLLHTESNLGWQGSNVQAQFVGCWVFLQSVLSRLALGIVREGTHMFALARPTLVGVARRLANDIEDHFTKPLLQSSGWSAWTDEQMFAPQRMAGYTATDYAQFHMPAIAHCFVASVLNIFLLHILRGAFHRYQLRLSPVATALFSSSHNLESLQDAIYQERCLCVNTGGNRHVRKGIQSYVLEAFAVLASLQEENNAILARREQLIREFMRRREEYGERMETEAARRKNKTASMNMNCKLKSTSNDKAHIFDKLLPHGSVMICSDVVGLLFRVLFEGGGAYKALRLAASAIHACRMLRHAAKQPLPHVVQSEKTVYKRVRQGGTGRKRVLRVRVPVLRCVDAEASEQTRTGAVVRPVGLYMQLGEAAVVEVARMGLRMGTAGSKLAHGVCTDCMRGSLVDHAAGRCLPAPMAADVHSDGSVSAAFGSKALQGILTLAGVGGGRQQSSHMFGAIIGERRIPPTSLLLEILVALTPFEDREAHTKYERWCAMDPQVLVNYRVVLAQQYHTARHHFGRANGVAAAAWLDVMRTGVSSLSHTTTVMLQKEELLLPVPVGFEEGTLLPLVNHHQRASPQPRTLEELRNSLKQSSDENIVTQNDGQNRGGYASYIAQCLALHVANPNALRRIRWAVVAGTLLAITEESLTGNQKVWSRLLLRNSFVIAQEATNLGERAQDTQATVRIFLLTDIFCPISRATPVVKQPLWYSATVRDLPRYLGVQIWLAEQLQTILTENSIPREVRHGLQLLPRLKLAAGLQGFEVNQTYAKYLLEPFLSQQELGAKWLLETFFGVQRDLIVWVIARVDKTDSQTMLSLAAWTTLLYLIGTITKAFNLLIIKKASRHCTAEQLHELREWLQTSTDK